MQIKLFNYELNIDYDGWLWPYITYHRLNEYESKFYGHTHFVLTHIGCFEVILIKLD